MQIDEIRKDSKLGNCSLVSPPFIGVLSSNVFIRKRWSMKLRSALKAGIFIDKYK